MEYSTISFPYPVLGNGDDINVKDMTGIEAEYGIADEAVTLKIENLSTGNKTVEDLVEAGAAQWIVRVKCNRTYFRKTYRSDSGVFEKRFSGPDLHGRVDIETFVIANGILDPYRPDGINPEYDTATFAVPDAAMLAIGPTFAFDVDKDFDALKAPVGSIMQVEEGDHQKGPFNLVLDDDKIIIKLSRDDWKNEYAGIRDSVPDLIHSSLVLPALAEAIRRIDEHSSTLWSGRLKAILEEKKISRSSPLQAAQILLNAPVSRTFASVNARLDSQRA